MWVFCHIKHALGIWHPFLHFLKIRVCYYTNKRSKRQEGQRQQRVLRWRLMNSQKGLHDVAVGGHRGLDSIRQQVSSSLIFLRDFSYLRKERRKKKSQDGSLLWWRPVSSVHFRDEHVKEETVEKTLEAPGLH